MDASILEPPIKKIRLRQGSSIYTFDGNNSNYTGNNNFGIRVDGTNRIMQTLESMNQGSAAEFSGGLNGTGSNSLANCLYRNLTTLLANRWSESDESHIRIYITVHSHIAHSGWSTKCNHVTSTAILDMPRFGPTNFDPDQSDASDGAFIFSTPFAVVSSTSGVSTGVLKAEFVGSQQSGSSLLSDIRIVNATSLNTDLDSYNIVHGSYVIDYAHHL